MRLEAVDCDEEDGWDNKISAVLSSRWEEEAKWNEEDEDQWVEQQLWEKRAEVVRQRRSAPVCRLSLDSVVVKAS